MHIFYTVPAFSVHKYLYKYLCYYLTRVLTYNQNIIELFHTINFRQQLVDHGVMDAGTSCHAASLLTDSINFIENDDV